MILLMMWKPIGGMKDAIALTALRHLRDDLDLMHGRAVVWNAYQSLRTLSDDDICWYYGCIRTLDIVEAYHPNRVVCQFGHVQSIPQSPIPPKTSTRSGSSKEYIVTHTTRDADFRNYLNHLVHISKRMGNARFNWETTSDYMTWYRSVVVHRLTM